MSVKKKKLKTVYKSCIVTQRRVESLSLNVNSCIFLIQVLLTCYNDSTMLNYVDALSAPMKIHSTSAC